MEPIHLQFGLIRLEIEYCNSPRLDLLISVFEETIVLCSTENAETYNQA